MLRGADHRAGDSSPVDDFEVAETERRTAAAVCLLVDLSYSMALRGTWGAAKQTALALHALVTTTYPQDAIADHRVLQLRPGDLQPDRAGRAVAGTWCRARTCSTR